MSNFKATLHLFAKLRHLATGEGDPELITAHVWSDAWNGRIIHEFGPESGRFVRVTLRWDSLHEPGRWEVDVNWSACGSQTPAVAAQYAAALTEAAAVAAKLEDAIKGASPLSHERYEAFEGFWESAKASLGEDTKPDEIAAAAYLLVIEASESTQSEAETILGALRDALAESSPPLALDIARLVEDIEADPDNDELWEQAQEFIGGRG